MPSPRRARREKDWPEIGDPHLESLMRQKVLPRFPELKRDDFRAVFGSTQQKALAQVLTRRLQKGRRIIKQSHLITINNHLTNWEQEELAALMAHEMGHLVNDLKGIRPKTWEEQELAATSQAVARGFINGFTLIFQRLCLTPCWERMEEGPDGQVVLRVKGRNLGGIYCVGEGGLFQTYCPFVEDLGIQTQPNTTWMQEVAGVQGVCVLCTRPLSKKLPAFQCSSCGMLYHQDCLNSYWKRAHKVCPSCRLPLMTTR